MRRGVELQGGLSLRHTRGTYQVTIAIIRGPVADQLKISQDAVSHLGLLTVSRPKPFVS
jgi:hypothetical protein